MRHMTGAIVIAFGSMISLAAAQTYNGGVPPGADPETGARPGNVIGTGMSLPRSDRASNISPSDTPSQLAPNLPDPGVPPSAPIRDYLMAARAALAAGRTGEAQQALEMAETRALDRSVPHLQTSAPIDDPLVAEIENALHTLSTGDHARAIQIIEAAISHASQS